MINKETGLVIDKICRSCMCENENMHSVFENKTEAGGSSSVLLSEMLTACASVEVSGTNNLGDYKKRNQLNNFFRWYFGDGLPYQLCDTCENKLNSAYEFRKQCQKSDSTLRELTGSETKENITLQEAIVVQPEMPDDFFDEEDEVPLMKRIIQETKKRKRGRPKKSDVVNLKSPMINQRYQTRTEIKQEVVPPVENSVPGENVRNTNLEIMSHDIIDNDSFVNDFPFSDEDDNHADSDDDFLLEVTKEKKIRKKRGVGKDETIYECKECSKTMTTYLGLKVHMRRHTGSDLSVCKLCNKSFTKQSHLTRHLRTHGVVETDADGKGKKEHGMSDAETDSVAEDSKIKNKPGGDSGTDAKEGAANINDESPGEKFSKMEEQDQSSLDGFRDGRTSLETRRGDHINKPYVCTICNKPFSRGEHLIRHLKVHQSSAEKEYTNLKCSICDTTFTRSDHLARHTKIHLIQDKRHVCVDCGKAFNRLDNLKTHQRIHSGIKDTSKLHLCIYCGKEFNNSSNMLRHSRVHTGERPYVCNICGRAFTQSNDLSLHMRRHTGARPYTCGVCPARFIQSGQLKAHRRTTGHWMETQPDLKGGYRVEPVTPAHEPIPIKFKSHGRFKKEVDTTEEHQVIINNVQEVMEEQAIEQVTITEVTVPSEPQRILMGIMGNIKIQNNVQPLLIDSSKIVELHEAGLVLPSVIQTADGAKSSLKLLLLILPNVRRIWRRRTLVEHSRTPLLSFRLTVRLPPRFTTSENFNFQNYN
ncbi:hypothetical protein NQ317_012363 [Molorchus minor]|uniref:Uncharacterized protein n=1 Tax=Molorchus minor TaxID=1323400 RepID=A0ABQ9J0M7_9CUCU|nr:hypothetical protein NQ317_012363 [Molorchus minor]